MLDAVDKTLIPGASNAELKALLVKVRPAFVAHLEHAKKIQVVAQIGHSSRLPRRGAGPLQHRPRRGGAAAKPTTHTVVMEAAVSFQPNALTIRVGDSVVWLNKDPFPHTATSAALRLEGHRGGSSWTYTPKGPGEFPYVCTLHPTMKGTLRIK